MSMPNAQDATTYKVTGQTERDKIEVSGPPVRGVTIFWTTGKGNSGSTWVPYSIYNQGPAAVAPLIAEAAGRMDAIGNLAQ